ncbi:MAG: potassium transporter TrkA [Oscillochloris sp.]|nr:potassium transporter TrkA [Oscillochloris sp.]
MEVVIYAIGFFVVCLASHRVGTFFSYIRLPYITGYLFTGALVASFGLDFIPTAASTELRFIDELSLAVIAFVAGSELFYKDLVSRLRALLTTVGAIMVVALLTLGVALYALTNVISFTAGMPAFERLAVALLGATVLLALSPPSTIAVIKELRARGPFTRLILGVTVIMDVAIIVLFAINASLSEALLTGVGLNIGFVALLLLDLGLAIGLGLLVGWILGFVLGRRMNRLSKIAIVLLIGYGIYALAGFVKAYTLANWPFEVYIEPLLIAMIGGFWVTNFTAHRDEFADILHDIGPAVYVAFFTLTGISLKLDVLLGTLGIAIVLFLVRGVALLVGGFLGGVLAGEPAQTRRYAWMGFVTQAGIALGLSREVAVAFPSLGDAFATLIISVIVLNEIFGPLFLRVALRRSGEVNLPEPGIRDQVRDVLILGVEAQSLALARQLKSQGWQVRMADTDAEHVRRLATTDVEEHHIAVVDEATLRKLVSPATDAIVAMLENDNDNLRACQLGFERFGVPRLIVRPNTMSMREQFASFGALVVDPATAMVSLLDQAVRAPQSLSLLLHTNSEYDVVQLTVTNPEVEGRLLRDLRLPNDVRLLEIVRDGQVILPHGYSRLRRNDEVTVMGKPEQMQEVMLALGY